MEKAKRIGSKYLHLVRPESIGIPKPPRSEQKDPIAELLHVLVRRMRDPQFYTEEERMLSHVVGREILDLVERNPLPLYALLHHDLKALKVEDPIMHQGVVGLLRIVQAEKLGELQEEGQAERRPDIPEQRSESVLDYGYADHTRGVDKTRR